jgi:hypothetical protein
MMQIARETYRQADREDGRGKGRRAFCAGGGKLAMVKSGGVKCAFGAHVLTVLREIQYLIGARSSVAAFAQLRSRSHRLVVRVCLW